MSKVTQGTKSTAVGFATAARDSFFWYISLVGRQTKVPNSESNSGKPCPNPITPDRNIASNDLFYNIDLGQARSNDAFDNLTIVSDSKRAEGAENRFSEGFQSRIVEFAAIVNRYLHK